MENLLRGWWKKEGGKVTYVGRREAGLAKRNETVRLTYPDGFWIEYEFGARDGCLRRSSTNALERIPTRAMRSKQLKKIDYMKFIMIDGVNAPWIIDHFVNGNQTSRINYESVQYNQPFADSLFAKPDNVKSIK